MPRRARALGIAHRRSGRRSRSTTTGVTIGATPARSPARTTPSTPPARSPCCVGARLRPRGRRPRSRGASRAPCAASSCTARSRGVQRLRRLRAPPHRGRRRARRGAHRRRRRPDHRDAPAAHVLAARSRCAGEFAEVLEQYADHTVVLDVYGAREDPVPGVTGELVSERVRGPGPRRTSCPTGRRPPTTRRAIAREGDFVITLGCGDVYRIIPQVLGSLERERGCGRAAREAAAGLRPPPAQRAVDAPAERRRAPRPRSAAARRADPAPTPTGHDRAHRRRAGLGDPAATGGRRPSADRAAAHRDRPIRCATPSRRPVGVAVRTDRAAAAPSADADADAAPRRRLRQVGSARSRRRTRAPTVRAPRCAASPSGRGGAASRGSVVVGIARRCSSRVVGVGAYSPLMALRDDRASRAPQRIDAADVQAALAGQLGTPLPLVDCERGARRRSRRFPLIETYSTEARPAGTPRRPDRRAHAGRRHRDRRGLQLVDAAGVVDRPTRRRRRRASR